MIYLRLINKLNFMMLFLMCGQAIAQCKDSTQMLDHMEEKYVELTNDSNETILLRVKVADDGQEQAAGFQYICPDVVADTAILFVFGHAFKPTFHMRNVHESLDIGFIQDDGLIADIQLMKEEISSGVPRLYLSDINAKYALEVHKGYFAENGITMGKSRLKIQ